MTKLLASLASDIIVRAQQLETGGKLTRSHVCYIEDMDLLRKYLETALTYQTFDALDPELRGILEEHLNAYMTRNEEIKEPIRKQSKAHTLFLTT